jgi:hypothetical protein
MSFTQSRREPISCGAAIRVKPKVSQRALGSATSQMIEPRRGDRKFVTRVNRLLIISVAPLGLNNFRALTQGSLTRLGLNADRCSAAS